MSGNDTLGQVVRLEAAQTALRSHFLGWQCRLRQLAVREAGGQPTSGMRPEVALEGAGDSLGRITLLIVRAEPGKTTAEFRHLFRRTRDPAIRYQDAVKVLSATYYQHPRDFSDELTALFGPDSETAAKLIEAGACSLAFAQYNQSYRLPCRLRELPEAHAAHQATYWHNALFNPAIPAGARVLGFQPDWARAEADPPVT